MSYIIYPADDGSVNLVTPLPQLDVQKVALKDVPAGVPYLIVEASELPPDHDFFDAWEADFSIPDGHGIGPEAFFAQYGEDYFQ